ncbi:hypothetical protein IMZ31_22655 (plasmid) [Pontibacillus sp. ALD_SL1]|uniref:hypothetical protein n=1 Tax=Pontibacillus sp. ALD_SL1 TaxID=2777185 RepID=UPI001A976235|nr:hypothetical protein [Pontibacillus sp. ALD_SL1]QST02258.1 hypothetical protein IMZ31_22655 [Pontibacillus sp. ALD_SL1]
MKIKSKKDIALLLEDFPRFTPFDERGKKHYLVFHDKKRGGTWTLMQYRDGVMTRHGKGEGYCDQGEERLYEEDQMKFLWENRKAVNAVLPSLLEV